MIRLFQRKLWVKTALPIAVLSYVLVEVAISFFLQIAIDDQRRQVGERLRDLALATASRITAEEHAAAIEAARAGESGRGFAVVADEVRKPAEITQNAAKDIGVTISAVRASNKATSETAEKGSAEVQRGAKLAEKAGTELEAIVQQVEHLGNLIFRVAGPSEEQSVTAGDITRNVEYISEVVSENNEGLRSVAEAAAMVHWQAEQLKTISDRFRLSEEALAPLYNGASGEYSPRRSLPPA